MLLKRLRTPGYLLSALAALAVVIIPPLLDRWGASPFTDQAVQIVVASLGAGGILGVLWRGKHVDLGKLNNRYRGLYMLIVVGFLFWIVHALLQVSNIQVRSLFAGLSTALIALSALWMRYDQSLAAPQTENSSEVK